jgi:uncharacterized protein (TIGR02118 family)
MVRLIALYRNEVDDAFRARYAEHVEICHRVPGLASLQAGPVLGSPRGPSEWTWAAILEWQDRESFGAAARTPEMQAAGEDALAFAPDHMVLFADMPG